MRGLVSMIVVSCVCALATTAVADEPAMQAELDKFKGTWEFESISVAEGKMPMPPKAEISFDGNVMTATMEGPPLKDPNGGEAKPRKATKKAKFTLKIDASPKQIDVTDETDGRQGRVEQGIYEFEGEKLKMCMGQPKQDTDTRPTAFDDKLGALIVMKRKGK